MQIKYRITLAFTFIVTIILSLLCSSVYFYSQQNRIQQFKDRIHNKAVSTLLLLKTRQFNVAEIIQINKSSPSFLFDKSIHVFDDKDREILSYQDPNTLPLIVTDGILSDAKKLKKYFFGREGRDAVAIHDPQSRYTVIVASYDEERVNWMTKLRKILAVCFIGSICIVVISGYIFSLGLVSSISNLRNKINHISSEDFLMRLDTGYGRDELQKLAITINDLLDRLQISFDTQRRFISNASHELSTPLTAITSQLDVALQRERTTEEYKRIIKSIKDDAKRLGLLTKSLLEIAKASGSAGGIELSSVRIDEVLMGLPSEMKNISKLYEVSLDFEEFPDNECIVYGNEALLYSALKNIVHNACKFSKDKTAHVRLNYTERNIIISVQDNGPGIEPEDLEQIFQPFFRGYKYKNTNLIHGTGLGLALAKRIINLHKGDIIVESTLGEGSTFKVILPLDKHKPVRDKEPEQSTESFSTL